MTPLKHDSIGPKVETLQQRLNNYGARLTVDAIYGDATEAAVRNFQRQHDLVADGIVGSVTWQALAGVKPANEILKQSDLEAAAKRLDVDIAAIQAITEVEAKDSGFVAPNRPVILFERHVMRQRMQALGKSTTQAEREYPNLVNKQPGGYQGGLNENMRLIRAQRICAAAAPEAASWGLFQIMGWHWEPLGYTDQYQFARLMHVSEQNQLDAFVRFIEASPKLHQALAAHEWATFAAGYNGPAYERNDYDTRLARAYARHAVAQPKPKRKAKTRKKTTARKAKQ